MAGGPIGQTTMIRRDNSLWIALSASLAIHATLAWAVVRFAGVPSGDPRSGFVTDQSAVFIPDADRPDDRMGEPDGHGYALNATPGEQPMRARQAEEDQALTGRDPMTDGAMGQSPAWQKPMAGSQGNQPEPLTDVTPSGTPSAPSQAFGVPAPTAPPLPMARSTPIIGRDGPGVSSEQPARSQDAPAVHAPDSPSESAQAANAPSPNQSAQAANPALDTGSEVDPFSKIGSAEFKNGRVEARFGRQVKARRPRLSLAGQVDVLRLQSPMVILKVDVNDQGNVTNVDVLKSSGSNEIDLACQHAVYDWWIQPPTDAQGRPRPDVIVWRISYHS